MNKYEDFDTEQRRLAILQQLQMALSYTINEVALKGKIKTRGHVVAMDDLRGDLRFLSDHDCLNYDTESGVWIATLTRKGNEVAEGIQAVNGIARPEPA